MNTVTRLEAENVVTIWNRRDVGEEQEVLQEWQQVKTLK